MSTTCRYPCSEIGMFRRFHTPPVLGPSPPRAVLFTGCPYQHAATKQRVWGEGGAGGQLHVECPTVGVRHLNAPQWGRGLSQGSEGLQPHPHRGCSIGWHRAVGWRSAVYWHRAVRGHRPLAQRPQGGTCCREEQRPSAQKPSGGTRPSVGTEAVGLHRGNVTGGVQCLAFTVTQCCT